MCHSFEWYIFLQFTGKKTRFGFYKFKENQTKISDKQFKSVEEASKRWKEEGIQYKDSLNEWLDIIYMNQENLTTACPEETRKDMPDYIIDTIGEYNEKENITNYGNYFRQI